uniref:Pre-mRNA-splicing regulator WTAP (Trinotate prediction) n=1 Tax=Myxobolus squamalis TaxID=59785 RepID=A0A6B2G421_MYXSQ
MTDPAINFLYSKLLVQLEEYKNKLKCAEDELTGANFTLDSAVGRKLVSKCRILQIENKELGKEFTEGRFRQLQIALKMERKHRVELEESLQGELLSRTQILTIW